MQPIKIAWASDIHLNFLTVDGEAEFLERIHAAGTDLLLLSGDISTADRLSAALQGRLLA